MGDRRYVFDQRNLKTGGLKRADSGLSSLAGALDEHLNGFHTMLHRGLGSRLGGRLRGEGSGLSGASEAHFTGGSP